MTGGSWTAVRIRSPKQRAAVICALFEMGAEAIQELDEDILTHIKDANRARLSAGVISADATADVSYSIAPDVDWSSAWRSRITAHQVGTLVVSPPWLVGNGASETRIVIDPGMAFGTGEHETTRGVLRLMQRAIRPGDVVADLGAGSAVLAIAAAKLGARRVVAIELDPDAIGNAEANVMSNGVADRVTVLEGDAFALLPLVAPVRVVLANIVSSVLLNLLPTIGNSLTGDGVAILSGILEDERPMLERSIRAAQWRVRESESEGMWWSATIARQ